MFLRYTEYFLIFHHREIASSSYCISFNFETITNVMLRVVVVDSCYLNRSCISELYERQTSTKQRRRIGVEAIGM